MSAARSTESLLDLGRTNADRQGVVRVAAGDVAIICVMAAEDVWSIFRVASVDGEGVVHQVVYGDEPVHWSEVAALDELFAMPASLFKSAPLAGLVGRVFIGLFVAREALRAILLRPMQ